MDKPTQMLMVDAIMLLIDMTKKRPNQELKLQQLNVADEDGYLQNYEITVKKV